MDLPDSRARARAAELRMPAVRLTDHVACRGGDGKAGVEPILGCEI